MVHTGGNQLAGVNICGNVSNFWACRIGGACRIGASFYYITTHYSPLIFSMTVDQTNIITHTDAQLYAYILSIPHSYTMYIKYMVSISVVISTQVKPRAEKIQLGFQAEHSITHWALTMSTRSLSLGVIIDYLPTDFKKFNQLGYKIAAIWMESFSQITPYMEAKILHKCGWFQLSKLNLGWNI